MLFHSPIHNDNDSLLQEFFSAESLFDLAALFEITPQKLSFLLYGEKKVRNQYTKFEIKKKSGGKRTILAPISSIKILQRKLNYILQLVYRPNSGAHGFIKERSILTNAKVHVGRRTILNVDLKDFFTSINFGRVRGLFLKKPFNFNENVATILAQLCCYEGVIPQGAPTSPVISNMICARLDKELKEMAMKYKNCFYSRYADDITFSTNSRYFHIGIAKYSFNEEQIMDLVLGDEFKETIESNGFKINYKKVRISLEGNHKEVTGIVINEKLNIPRNYIRKLRSMLYAWERFGLENAHEEHFSVYDKDNRLFKNNRTYQAIVKGRIDYLGMVRGKRDYIYNGFYNRYNYLIGNSRPRLPVTSEEELENSIFVVNCNPKQGTGFLIKNVGLITCYHVVDSGSPIKVYKGRDRLPEKQYNARILYSKPEWDLAILSVDFPDDVFKCCLELASKPPVLESTIMCIGFSDHNLGESYQKNTGKIDSIRKDKRDNDFYGYSLGLFSGQSGGPALNKEKEVVGVISLGSANPGVAPRAAEIGIIPLDFLKNFIKNISTK